MQKLQPPNKTYERALIWYETQTKYVIDCTLKGSTVEVKTFKDNLLIQTKFEPFSVDFANIIQQKIINLYNYVNTPSEMDNKRTPNKILF